MKYLFNSLTFLVCFFSLILAFNSYAVGEWSGYVAGEFRYFPHSPLSDEQFEHVDLSIAAQPQYHLKWDNGYQTFTFVPFIRADWQDQERTHFDIRELTWLKAERSWELRLGIRKLFWGVTESQHLVDIINQTDLIENLDGEEKLGQPMINFALIKDWGTVDFFLLPYFRERTFPGEKGRLLAGGIPIATDQARYESGAKEKHLDFAVRWYHYFGDIDIGLSHFSGTSREPRLLPETDGVGQLHLIPYYEQIHQTGLDLQITKEEILGKLELISRQNEQGRYTALTGGFEYTFVGVFDSDADVGLLGEYLFDDRKDNATTPFENDLMIGTRLTFNDIQSTELLAGIIFDLDSTARFYNLEASRRLGDSWKLTLEARIYSDMPTDDLSYGLREDDYLQLELAWYF
jgi:hypothetical protein